MKKRSQRILVSLSIIIILFVVFYNFSIKPKNKKIKEMEETHKRVKAMLESSMKYIDKFKSIKVAYDSISAIWEALQEYLPDEEEMPKLLSSITDAGKGIKFLLFKPQKPIEQQFYKEYQIEIKVTGSYHGVGSFLSRIGALPRLVNVKNLILKGTNKPEEYLEADFIAIAYASKK